MILPGFPKNEAAAGGYINIQVDTPNVDVFVLLGSPSGPAYAEVFIAAGATVYSEVNTIGALIVSGFAPGSIITVRNNGTIEGIGGQGWGASAFYSGSNNRTVAPGAGGGGAGYNPGLGGAGADWTGDSFAASYGAPGTSGLGGVGGAGGDGNSRNNDFSETLPENPVVGGNAIDAINAVSGTAPFKVQLDIYNADGAILGGGGGGGRGGWTLGGNGAAGDGGAGGLHGQSGADGDSVPGQTTNQTLGWIAGYAIFGTGSTDVNLIGDPGTIEGLH